jgi:hypothetical protein
MKILVIITMLGMFQNVFAEGINERQHPDPAAQSKINRVLAQAWSMQKPPTDNISVIQNATSKQFANNQGVNLGLSVGSVTPGRLGQTPRENTVVTRDNIVICVHCQGGR